MRVRSILFSVVVLMSCVMVHAQQTIHVPAGGNLQAAFNMANYGDVIVVQAGATFDSPSEPFITPAKPGESTSPIIVRSSASDRLPSGHVTPADAPNMFRLRATTAEGALKPARNSRNWKFIGMEVTSNGSAVAGRLIDTGTPQGGTDDPATWGDNFTFDRCYIHPLEDGTSNYNRTADVGFGWNAGQITITNSRISGFGGVRGGAPIASGAFWSNVGGPYLIDNSYLSAGFNPIFLGAGENGSPNTATITAVSPNSVTLSNVSNMQVGDKIALGVHLPSSGGYDFWLYGVQVDPNTDTFTYAGHGFNNGDACYVDSHFDQIAAVGLKPKYQKYFIINRTDNTFQLSADASPARARRRAGGSPVDLTGATSNGGIKVGANGHKYANAQVTSINGNIVSYARLVRWEGDQHPDSIQPYQYVISSQLPLVGGKATWRGYQVHDFTFIRSTIDIDFGIASHVKQQTGSNAKGYMEIKNLVRGLIEGNIFTGYPTSLALTNASQNSTSPWVTIKDLMIRNNLFESFSTMLIAQLVSGTMSEEGSNIQLINNLGYNIRDVVPILGQAPNMLYTAGGTGQPLIARHNTVINKPTHDGASAWLGILPMPNPNTDTGQGVVFEDNVAYYGRYGVQAGSGSWNTTFPHFSERGNVWIDHPVWTTGAEYITGANGHFPRSFYAASDAAVKFVNPQGRDYSLAPDSPYKGKASDGKDPGVDMDQLLAAIGGAVSAPSPAPTPVSTPLPQPSPSVSPTPVASPVPTPTPVPGSRLVEGYLKINGEYFNERAIVTANHPSIIAQTFSASEGGFFSFESIPAGSVLTAKGDGYVFGPVTVDSGPYFILTGSLAAEPTPTPLPTSTPTPQPTPVSTPSPSPSPVETPTPSPSPIVPTPTPTPTPVQCGISAPTSITVNRNGIGLITVTLSGLTGPTEVRVNGSDGQVTVSPLVWQAGPTSSTRQFIVRVKRQSRTITFQSPCGSVSVKVNVT